MWEEKCKKRLHTAACEMIISPVVVGETIHNSDSPTSHLVPLYPGLQSHSNPPPGKLAHAPRSLHESLSQKFTLLGSVTARKMVHGCDCQLYWHMQRVISHSPSRRRMKGESTETNNRGSIIRSDNSRNSLNSQCVPFFPCGQVQL